MLGAAAGLLDRREGVGVDDGVALEAVGVGEAAGVSDGAALEAVGEGEAAGGASEAVGSVAHPAASSASAATAAICWRRITITVPGCRSGTDTGASVPTTTIARAP